MGGERMKKPSLDDLPPGFRSSAQVGVKLARIMHFVVNEMPGSDTRLEVCLGLMSAVIREAMRNGATAEDLQAQLDLSLELIIEERER
jgi:hypothetical protein